MPRYNAILRYPDGSSAVIHSGKPITACQICGAKLAPYLCDFELPGGNTCDTSICDDCRVNKGPEIDWCNTHVVAI